MSQKTSVTIPPVEIEDIRAHDLLTDPVGSKLVERYREECAKPPFAESAPDAEAYKAMESIGNYRLAWMKKDGKPIGFVGVLVCKVPHFSMVCASIESLYLAPEHRKGFNGLRLLKWAKTVAKQAGAVGITMTAVEGTRLEQLATRLGRKTSHNFFLEV